MSCDKVNVAVNETTPFFLQNLIRNDDGKRLICTYQLSQLRFGQDLPVVPPGVLVSLLMLVSMTLSASNLPNRLLSET